LKTRVINKKLKLTPYLTRIWFSPELLKQDPDLFPFAITAETNAPEIISLQKLQNFQPVRQNTIIPK